MSRSVGMSNRMIPAQHLQTVTTSDAVRHLPPAGGRVESQPYRLVNHNRQQRVWPVPKQFGTGHTRMKGRRRKREADVDGRTVHGPRWKLSLLRGEEERLAGGTDGTPVDLHVQVSRYSVMGFNPVPDRSVRIRTHRSDSDSLYPVTAYLSASADIHRHHRGIRHRPSFPSPPCRIGSMRASRSPTSRS